jgi:hypothetical protein
MGRTNPTFREFLRRYRESWAPFRRALRRRDQADFDRLFDGARRYADAAGYRNGVDPETAVLVAMLLAHERELAELRGRLDDASDGPSGGDSPDGPPADSGSGRSGND